MNPLVTIGIPCYRQAEYLPYAIDSALGQTYQNIEIIFVDDGSDDNSLAIAKEYPIKVIHQVNKGLASARNTAIMNMRGNYFLPLDADDILKPNCVERIVEVAMQTNADVIGPSLQEFGVSNAVTILTPEPTLAHFRLGNHLGYFSAIKRSALLECGGYSPKMVEGYEDYHLWFDLLTRGKKIVTIPEVLVMYQTKEKSMYRDAVKHHAKLMAQIFKDFPQSVPKEITTL